MVDFDLARGLGFWGCILILSGIAVGFLLGPLSVLFTPLLGLLGYALLLASFYMLSRYYGRGSIFWSALASLALGWIGLLALSLLVLGALRSSEIPGGLQLARLALTTILGLIVVQVTSAIFWYKALSELHEASGEHMVERAAFAYGLSTITLALTLITIPIAIIALPLALISLISFLLNWVFLALGFRNLGEREA